MKCPKCGEEVKQGSLFCPNCLEEIPWVAEYNTLDTMEKKSRLEHKKRISLAKAQAKRYLPARRKRRTLFVLAVCMLLAYLIGMASYRQYRNTHSYAWQYQKAEQCFKAGQLDKALEHVDKAIMLEGFHVEAHHLMARILEAEDDVEGAIKVLEACLLDFSDRSVIYEELIFLYLKSGQPEKIKILLDDCSHPQIKREFGSYITADPQISHDTGSYSKHLQVEISGSCEKYYYTLDGTDPDRTSPCYLHPIEITEGTTELRVIGYSSIGVPSDVIFRRYVVTAQGPKAPVILPAETEFEEATMITIRVPEGYVCYYAFDEMPEIGGAKYTGPISMPEGTHTLYAFVVGGNGKVSPMSSKTYTLQY